VFRACSARHVTYTLSPPNKEEKSIQVNPIRFALSLQRIMDNGEVNPPVAKRMNALLLVPRSMQMIDAAFVVLDVE